MNWEDELKKEIIALMFDYYDHGANMHTIIPDASANVIIDSVKSLLKKRDDALKTLAMLGLQSRCYEEYIDFRLAVDNALEIIKGGSDG